LDKETILQSVAKTGRLILIDNAHRTCNAAAEIAATVVEEGFEYLKRPIVRLSTPDVHIPFSPVLEKPLYPSQEAIMSDQVLPPFTHLHFLSPWPGKKRRCHLSS
jgi:pyruvate dehydrogenase E1 component beta subunit